MSFLENTESKRHCACVFLIFLAGFSSLPVYQYPKQHSLGLYIYKWVTNVLRITCQKKPETPKLITCW